MRGILALVFATILLNPGANAADYPDKPIRVIIPYAAGSTGEAASVSLPMIWKRVSAGLS